MGKVTEEHRAETTQVQAGGELEYRELSVPAVLALVFGLLSVFALATWVLWILPLAAWVAGFIAIRRIKSAPSEWTGLRLAYAGIALGVVFLVAGVASTFVTNALIKLHARAIADRFVRRMEQGDIEGAFWLAVDRSQRQLALQGKLDKEHEDYLFQMYADFYRRVQPKLASHGPNIDIQFQKFVGRPQSRYGQHTAELIYVIPGEDKTYHVYVRAVGVKSRERLWQRDWIIGFVEIEPKQAF
jgi:hypothetical protein